AAPPGLGCEARRHRQRRPKPRGETMTPRHSPTAPARGGGEFTQGKGYALPEYPFVEPPEIQAGEPSHHPIVIVGAGLAGLTLACALARYGVAAVLLDDDNTV